MLHRPPKGRNNTAPMRCSAKDNNTDTQRTKEYKMWEINIIITDIPTIRLFAGLYYVCICIKYTVLVGASESFEGAVQM